jgi:hypothetical protein
MNVRKELHFDMVHHISPCSVENVGHAQFPKGEIGFNSSYQMR